MVYMRTGITVIGMVAFLSVCAVSADTARNIRITEFLYNAEGADEGKEYVEIFNAGPDSVNMNEVKFYAHGKPRTLHAGERVLEPGTVAIIAEKPEEFLARYSFDGPVIGRTRFSLNNTESTLEIRYRGTVHTVPYRKSDGADGDGNALHVSADGTLSASTPSPGTVSGIPVAHAEKTAEQTERERKEDAVPEEAEFVTDPSVVFSASVTVFSVREKGAEKELYGSWNFGDGVRVFGGKVSHAYLYPGEYIVSFREYRDDEPTGTVAKKTVTVLFPDIATERIDGAFIRFRNRHPFTLDISGWKLVVERSEFTFPSGSFIAAEDSVIVPFPTRPDERILFITSGGGQFSGTRNARESGPPTAGTAPEREPEESGEPENVPADAAPEPSRRTLLAVWISLLIGIIVIAVAPLLLLRSENMRRIRRPMKIKGKE